MAILLLFIKFSIHSIISILNLKNCGYCYHSIFIMDLFLSGARIYIDREKRVSFKDTPFFLMVSNLTYLG